MKREVVDGIIVALLGFILYTLFEMNASLNIIEWRVLRVEAPGVVLPHQ